MSGLAVVMRKDLREAARSRSFWVGVAISVLVGAALCASLGQRLVVTIMRASSLGQAVAAAEPLFGSILLSLAVTLMLLLSFYINSYSIVMEKVRRSLESLLSTPLGVTRIWMAKSLAIALPSIVFGWLMSMLAAVALNLLFFLPQTGSVILPGPAPLVAILALAPIVILVLAAILSGLQLVLTNIRWINAIFMLAIIGLNVALSTASVMQLGPGSWLAVLVLLGAVLVFGIAFYVLSRFVTAERIVLSSKS